MNRQRPIRDCYMPWNWLIISPLGDVQPCCWASDTLGSLKHNSVEEIWNGPKMVRLRAAIRDGFIDPVCKHAGCRFVSDMEREFGVDSYDFRYEMDTLVEVSKEGRTNFCVSGWARHEDWGVWSMSKSARLIVDLPAAPQTPLKLQCLSKGFGGAPDAAVRVTLDGLDIGVWKYLYPDEAYYEVWREADIPLRPMAGNRLDIEFHVEALTSPKAFGFEDGRELGFGLSLFRIISDSAC